MTEKNLKDHCDNFKKCLETGLDDLCDNLEDSGTQINVDAIAGLSKCLYNYAVACVAHEPSNFSEKEKQSLRELADHANQIHLTAMRLKQEADERKNQETATPPA
ncbi:MAG: hypothetical protein ACE5DI_01610 [Candidatus Micrarchaeia archaeon]